MTIIITIARHPERLAQWPCLNISPALERMKFLAFSAIGAAFQKQRFVASVPSPVLSIASFILPLRLGTTRILQYTSLRTPAALAIIGA